MNGPLVLPPVYEKKVGRPPKSRKKQPHEVKGKSGPKLSRHGIIIHCKYCSEAGHNSGGCKLKRMGFSSEEAKQLVATTQATLQKEKEQEAMQAAANLVVENEVPTQDDPSYTIYVNQHTSVVPESTMLSHMLQEVKFVTHDPFYFSMYNV